MLVKHVAVSEERALQLLETLKRRALARGRGQHTIERDRRESEAEGRTSAEIAAMEFAEMAMFDDMASESADVVGAAVQGTPSEVSMALAERDGYCPACVRGWYGILAEAYRAGMSS